jgi:hypothetical protein
LRYQWRQRCSIADIGTKQYDPEQERAARSTHGNEYDRAGDFAA